MDEMKWQVTIHTHMCLDGYMVADVTRAEVVRLLHIRKGTNDICDLLFRFRRQRTLGQFPHALVQKFPGHSD